MRWRGNFEDDPQKGTLETNERLNGDILLSD